MSSHLHGSKRNLQHWKIVKQIIAEGQTSQAGFTIVESLIALLVISILLVAIAPVLALSVATRVQARRVELASQAARAYIDGVRIKKIDPPVIDSDRLETVNAPTPTGSFNCTANSYCTNTATSSTATDLYCIDVDNSGSCTESSTTDMVLQVFGYNPTQTDANKGYELGVRVYRADAFRENSQLLRNTPSEKVQKNPFAGGTGARKAPLVEMAADISDIEPKYKDLCERFNTPSNRDDCT